MFFSESELVPRERARLATLPPIPETGWRPRAEFPNLSDAIAIGVDLEVKEEDFDHGPGWSRGKAHIVGASINAISRSNVQFSNYYPIRHEVENQFNLDDVQVLRYLNDILNTPHIPKFGANLIYDIGNAADEGISIKGELHDCQFAEALCDEEGLIDLDYLGKKYLTEGKTTSTLYEWCANAYGGKPTASQRDNIWRASPRLVGPYAESDASMPRQILAKQWTQLDREGLTDLYRMECDLIPLYVRMRQQGVRVDVKKAEEIYVRLTPLIADLYKKVKQISGVSAESTTGGDIRKIFEALGIEPPRTELGNPSFNKEWLNQLDHPIANVILEIRKMEIVQNTFLQKYIIEGNTNGVIHAEFHPLRNDEGGTRTGRFSSSNPNLQNIPGRTDLGKEIRTLFLPFEGHASWHKGDFSQIQYRALAHYAVGQGSNELRQEYATHPDTDYHDRTQAMVKAIVGLSIPRRPIKNLNFANVMGAGKNKVKRMIQLDSDEIILDKQVETFYNAYHQANPYVKATLEALGQQAGSRGFVCSLLNRRMRFNLWEPFDNWDNKRPGLPYNEAIRCYGQIKRAGTYKSVSGILQGTEADIMKSAMRKALMDGVYDVTGVPTLTVHDELGFSVIDESKEQNEAYRYMHYLMENTLTMSVPIKYEADRGPNWGAIE